jgi:lipopolysaccharide heptosyltransferase II
MRIICFHLNQVGDFAFSLPAIKCIRDSFPDAEITSVIRPACSDLLMATGLVDEVLSRNNRLNIDKARLAGHLIKTKYDIAVAFSQSAGCALLAYLTGAKKRLGFINTSLGSLLTQRIPFTHPPSTENNLNLVSALGCDITSRSYSGLLKLTDQQIESGDNILRKYGLGSDDKIVTFAPGTSGRRSVKEWTDEGYVKVARHLTDKGYRVVILGTVPAIEITSECPAIIDLSGKTSLTEAAGVLYRSRTLLAVDSGMLHIAAALGKRVVGLYGPSNRSITGPQGDGHIVLTSGAECSPCMQTVCKLERKCMTDIDLSSVIEAVDKILAD